MIDCLIIGGGPAGLLAPFISAGICEAFAWSMLARAGQPKFRKAIIIQALRHQRIRTTAQIEAQEYGVPSTTDRVTSLRREDESFVASCKSGNDVNARFVLLATGLVDHCPPIEGELTNCASDAIRFCPICDGYEAMDQRVGVLGGIDAGSKKALFLRTYTEAVSLFLTDETIDAVARQKLDENDVRVVHKPKRIKLAPECTVAILTESGERHELDALYPALGCTVRSELATALGASCTENGNLLVDDHQITSVEGLYAAGDVMTDLHQLSVAFGHAAIAATDIHNRLPSNPRQNKRLAPKSVAEPRSVQICAVSER